jgi:hypothetical protein
MASWGEHTQEVIPGTARAYLDQVTRHFGALADSLGKCPEVGQRQPTGGKARAKSEGDMDELLVFANGALGVGLPP